MWVYLLALTLVPAIVLPVFGAFLSSERLDAARSARQISVGMDVIEHLDELGTAITAEQTSAAVTAALTSYHLSIGQLDALVGFNLAVALPDARRATDHDLAVLVASPDRPDGVAALSGMLARVRATGRAGSSSAAGTGSPSPWMAIQAYGPLAEDVAALESETATRVAAGHYGVGSGPLLFAANQLEQVTEVVSAERKQMQLTFLVALAPASNQAALMDNLESATASFQDRAATLSSSLNPALASRWRQLLAAPQTVRSEAFAGTYAKHAPSFALSSGILDAAHAAVTAGTAFDAFLAEAVREGTTTASADSAHAGRTATLAIALSAGALSATLFVLVFVGALIRRRLRGLSDAANAFSAGALEVVEVRGPREVAAASTALNHAVAGLKQIQVQAGLLARGELDSADLESAVEGPLGSAIHESVQRLVAATRDQDELRRQLAHQATHDTLTELPNRAQATTLLETALEEAAAEKRSVAVLFVDLDMFKECNDTYGHQAGDQTLRVTADRMRDEVGDSGVVCRLGGDEFVVIAPTLGIASSAEKLGVDLIAAIEQSIYYKNAEITISASVGLAMSHSGSEASDLLRQADIALYSAKAGGRGQVQTYVPTPSTLETLDRLDTTDASH